MAFQVSAKKWGHNVAHTVVWARVCGPGIASSPLSSCTKDREIRTDFEIARSRSRETSALFSSVELLRIQRLSCRVCVPESRWLPNASIFALCRAATKVHAQHIWTSSRVSPRRLHMQELPMTLARSPHQVIHSAPVAGHSRAPSFKLVDVAYAAAKLRS